MAKIILENHREHDITLAHEAGTLVVPAARDSATKKGETVPGVAEADDALIADLRKKSPVVEHYFAEGWLRVAKQAKAAAEAKQPAKE